MTKRRISFKLAQTILENYNAANNDRLTFYAAYNAYRVDRYTGTGYGTDYAAGSKMHATPRQALEAAGIVWSAYLPE